MYFQISPLNNNTLSSPTSSGSQAMNSNTSTSQNTSNSYNITATATPDESTKLSSDQQQGQQQLSSPSGVHLGNISPGLPSTADLHTQQHQQQQQMSKKYQNASEGEE